MKNEKGLDAHIMKKGVCDKTQQQSIPKKLGNTSGRQVMINTTRNMIKQELEYFALKCYSKQKIWN